MSKKQKRLIAAGLTLLMLFAAALSVCITVAEATHDCNGAECHICDVIHIISGILRVLIAAVVTGSCFFAAAAVRRTDRRAAILLFIRTPVTEKVRLLN